MHRLLSVRKCTYMNFKQRLAAWAQGRYGSDRLNKVLLWFSIIMWIISACLSKTTWQLLPLSLGWLALVYSTFRMFSRNIYTRQRELAFYDRITEKPRRFFKLQKNKWRDRKTHRYFRCSCGAVLRVPKGHGEIVIKCPKCNSQLHKKT